MGFPTILTSNQEGCQKLVKESISDAGAAKRSHLGPKSQNSPIKVQNLHPSPKSQPQQVFWKSWLLNGFWDVSPKQLKQDRKKHHIWESALNTYRWTLGCFIKDTLKKMYTPPGITWWGIHWGVPVKIISRRKAWSNKSRGSPLVLKSLTNIGGGGRIFHQLMGFLDIIIADKI